MCARCMAAWLHACQIVSACFRLGLVWLCCSATALLLAWRGLLGLVFSVTCASIQACVLAPTSHSAHSHRHSELSSHDAHNPACPAQPESQQGAATQSSWLETALSARLVNAATVPTTSIVTAACCAAAVELLLATWSSQVRGLR